MLEGFAAEWRSCAPMRPLTVRSLIMLLSDPNAGALPSASATEVGGLHPAGSRVKVERGFRRGLRSRSRTFEPIALAPLASCCLSSLCSLDCSCLSLAQEADLPMRTAHPFAREL